MNLFLQDFLKGNFVVLIKFQNSFFNLGNLLSTESIVRGHLMIYLKLNQLIMPRQHGLVPNRSFIENLLKTVIIIITVSVNREKTVDIVFLILPKIKSHNQKLLIKHSKKASYKDISLQDRYQSEGLKSSFQTKSSHWR